MKKSKYINKLALINIVKKKQRTILSLIAISLSVAVILTSLMLFSNVYELTKTPNRVSTGEYHYVFENNKYLETSRLDVTYDYSLDLYTEFEGNNYSFRELSIDNDISPIILVDGRMPSNSDEIVVASDSNLSLGTNISLNLIEMENQTSLYKTDESVFENVSTISKSFTVVGFYQATSLVESLANSNLIYTSGYDLTSKSANTLIKDQSIQSLDSLLLVQQGFGVESGDIVLNQESISYDTIKNYLQDTTTLLLMFVAIIIIAILMSLISLKNIFIITDKDKKKEFGLLKSIGATPVDIKSLLLLELVILGVIGSLIGLIIGFGISSYVLTIFVKQLAMTYSLSMVLKPMILIGAFIAGVVLMLFMGYNANKKYITSSAIEDLKDVTYQYDTDFQKKHYQTKSFSWKMFLIYNGRLRKQTRNIFHSFALLILTTVMFVAIIVSNIAYIQETSSLDYDYEVTNSISTNSATKISVELYNDLYNAIDDGQIEIEKASMRRLLLGPYIQYPSNSIDQTTLKTYKASARVSYVEKEDELGDTYAQVQTTNILLDNTQIEKLEPYLVAGSLEDAKNGGAIVVLSKDNELSEGLFTGINIGDRLYLSTDLDVYENVVAIVVVDNTDSTLYYDYSEYDRIVAYNVEYALKYEDTYTIMESGKIYLKNQATSASATLAIETALGNSSVVDTYSYDNVLLRTQENRVISFLIESLFYPLFMLLFVISLLNIYNVLVGNIHLKRGDISIMKSVGMSTTQLYKLFAYEYLEGYFNAAVLVTAIFVPLCIIEGKLGLSSAFRLGENIIITLIVAIMVIDIMLIAAMVVMTMLKIKNVQPIENMKDVA